MIQSARENKIEVNTLRSSNNLKNLHVEKLALTSIKERVIKQHKTTFLRRKRQLKEMQPPSTSQIYSTNQASQHIKNGFTLVATKQQKPNEDGVKKELNQTVPCNLRNPLSDYSFRLALQHTARGAFRLNQKKVTSVI